MALVASQVCDPGGEVTDVNSFLVGEPGAVVFEGKVYLYFAGNGYDTKLANPVFSIGLATSPDALSWSKPIRALSPDQVQYPRASWLGYSTPAALVLGGEVHLFFDVIRDMPFTQVALRHARSADGANGFIQDEGAIFSTADFAFTAREIRAPSPLLDGTKVRLWFAGDDGGASPTLSIGQAACAL